MICYVVTNSIYRYSLIIFLKFFNESSAFISDKVGDTFTA